MAIDAVASIVIDKLEYEMSSFTNDMSTTHPVCVQLDRMRPAGFSYDGANSEQIKELTRKYIEILYDAEDAIESFSLRMALRRKRFALLMNLGLFNPLARRLLATNLDRIQRKLKDLECARSVAGVLEDLEAENGEETIHNGDYEVDNTVRAFNPHSRKDSLLRERLKQGKLLYSKSFDGEQSMPANKQVLGDLLGRLEHGENDDFVIHIVGKPGSGKTVLARAVYGSKVVKEKFKDCCCAWVSVYKEFTPLKILKKLLVQVEKSEEDSSTLDDENSVRSRLQELLTSQKYLIVLDGVQDSDQWRKHLKGAFPEKNGSKIILTTCDLNWTGEINQPCKLKELERGESWDLFLSTAGLTKEREKLSTLKERFDKLCDGLPLNIVLLGSWVSTKEVKRVDDLSKILYSPQALDTADILTLIYNDLDMELKLCLLYMTLFPKDLDVPVRRLQRLWLAEGFAKQPNGGDIFKEDVVEKYFDCLVRRSLILVSRQRSDGSPRKCRLIGVLQDFLLEKAKEINLYYCHPGSSSSAQPKPRRLIQFADGKDCSLIPDEFHHLRSYISFNIQKKDIQARDVGMLLSDMIGKNGLGLLRVLDLEGVYQPSLPENLGNLLNLRYLGLRWTFLDKLPKSVGELLYLENLDIKHTRINVIPPSIWKLKHLRHLNLNRIHLDNDKCLDANDSLPKLLTLCGLSVDHKSPVKDVLSKLTHVRELDISFRRDDDKGNSASELVEWISNLTSLCSLRLHSQYNSGYPADLCLKSFSKLDKLTHMRLYGILPRLPETGLLPPNIRVLTLSVLGLTDDPMSTLGALPCLTVLRLLGNSYIGDKLFCPRNTFTELLVLKLWNLEHLTEWELEEGAMDKLKEANIRLCRNLRNIPDKILKQKTFKYLTLTNMTEEFKHEIKQVIDRDQVSITEKNFNFSTRPDWDQVQDIANEGSV